MLMAFLLHRFVFTGQTSTQTAQPVQSSGATAACSDRSPCPSTWLGPLQRGRRIGPASALYTLARITRAAHHHAFSALDAEVLVPHRNELRDVALFPLRCPVGTFRPLEWRLPEQVALAAAIWPSTLRTNSGAAGEMEGIRSNVDEAVPAARLFQDGPERGPQRQSSWQPHSRRACRKFS